MLQEIYKNLDSGIKIEQERIISLQKRFGELEAERLVIANGSSFSKRSKLEKLATQQETERTTIKTKNLEANNKIDALRVSADAEIKKLREKIDQLREQASDTKDNSLAEIDKYNNLISGSQGSIDTLSNGKFKLGDKLRAIEVEVGPVKYVAELLSGMLGREIAIDGAVKTLILSIIFVFDPLAILLLLASTSNLRFKFMSPHEKLQAVAKWG